MKNQHFTPASQYQPNHPSLHLDSRTPDSQTPGIPMQNQSGPYRGVMNQSTMVPASQSQTLERGVFESMGRAVVEEGEVTNAKS